MIHPLNNFFAGKTVIPLRFRKSGSPEIEKIYATHYVDHKCVSQLKA